MRMLGHTLGAKDRSLAKECKGTPSELTQKVENYNLAEINYWLTYG